MQNRSLTIGCILITGFTAPPDALSGRCKMTYSSPVKVTDICLTSGISALQYKWIVPYKGVPAVYALF